MSVIKTATRITFLLAIFVSSVAALPTGATISAFAQLDPAESPVDLEQPILPQTPGIPGEEDLIPCLPPPGCLLPGAEVCPQVCWPSPQG